ncbi:MAG: pilus (MSHA type) biogenesis protein MshL [Herminiimonas sp.]|nr:pilus (MSHA type) biogenesis protein MshL [Herminiimonas sp.]
MIKAALTLTACILLSACGTRAIAPSAGHLRDTPKAIGNIPDPVRQSAVLTPPKPTAKLETFSVTVYNVPVQSLLFALARDAKLNVDVHPGIEGNVTLNAINQTLPQLLTRISQQIDMRFEISGPNLIVTPDTPFLRNYKIDYVNIARNSESKISIATQISSAGGSVVGAAGGSGDNNSTTSVTNTSNNRFWETLVQNIKDTLHETDKTFPENTDGAAAVAEPAAVAGKAATAAAPRTPKFREAASVIANPEASLIAVRATSRQHDKLQEFLDVVMNSAKRQVLIEATVIEVQLNENYQQGINWSSLRNTAPGEGFNFAQGKIGTTPLPTGISPGITPGIFAMSYINPTSALGNLSAAISLLESFGKVKVLSSPKISVLNNQTALLKVVDNEVYFLITATTTQGTVGVAATSVYTSELRTVPVGFVMSVTPQIAESDEVSISVRPSISRIIGYVQDPNPALAAASVVSRVPVIQTREMESILKVASGQIAVMGGLMQDSIDNQKDGIPLLGRIPVFGDAFNYRNESTKKSELVIFMRPVVVKNASITGDYKDYRSFLPDNEPLNKQPYTESSPISAEKTGASGS